MDETFGGTDFGVKVVEEDQAVSLEHTKFEMPLVCPFGDTE